MITCVSASPFIYGFASLFPPEIHHVAQDGLKLKAILLSQSVRILHAHHHTYLPSFFFPTLSMEQDNTAKRSCSFSTGACERDDL